MPWIIGIDEAGYGPNLGPFVMTAVACRVPELLDGCDLWATLADVVRRHPSADDGRLLIEDSKLVYSRPRGLRDLERGVLATLGPWQHEQAPCLDHCIDWLCPQARQELGLEAWYTGTSTLPVQETWEALLTSATRFRAVSAQQEVVWGMVRSTVVCPARFNEVIDKWGTKGAVLGHTLGELVTFVRSRATAGEGLRFTVDKHGGRNNYSAMLQHAWSEGLVVAHEESMQCSAYSILGLERDIRFTFKPRADATHFCVALASMVSKYLRELLMREFNEFWLARVPGLKPTAGYPGDAARFYAAIRPVVEKLGMAEASLWRRK